MNLPIGLRYRKSCVNCGSVNTDERNLKGLPCEICMPEEGDPREILPKIGTLKNLKGIWDFQDEYREFEGFFREKIGEKPTGFQRVWMKRIILKKSFTAVAPTGTGKTTFGIVAALWYERKRKKSAIILPTVLLVDQVFEKLKDLGAKGVVRYHSKLKKSERSEALEKISSGDFSTLVMSTQFLSRNFDKLKDQKFDFVFVDDVDAVLKSSRNIDKLVLMLGIPEEIIQKAYLKLTKKRDIELPKVDHGVLVVSSATAKPRGIKPLLFREILGFEVGSLVVSSRNVLNIRCFDKSLEKLLEIAKILEDGILIFVRRSEEVKDVVNLLKENRIKAAEASDENLEKFKNGEINALVGVGSYYGKLVRGIDIPQRIKYAVFFGVPVFEYPISKDKAPLFVIRMSLRHLSKENKKYRRLLRIAEKAKRADDVRDMLRTVPDDEWNDAVRKAFERFEIENGVLKIPDVLTYIQASGRTSRYTKWGLTRGISVVLEDDRRLFDNLQERLEWLTEEEWVNYESVDWGKEIKEVEDSRKERRKERVENKSVLFIVESPTKAMTISSFFGRSSSRSFEGVRVYEAIFGNDLVLFTASRGHVYDLVTDEGIYGVEESENGYIPIYGTVKRCRSCGYQFTEDLNKCPVCGSTDIDDKTTVLNSLREIAMEVDEVYVATDPDTEGEKISYDIEQYIKPVNSKVERVELHEITRSEVKKKYNEPRDFNEMLVKAQIVRRVQDRWVGFELSKKVQSRFKKNGLSAGRVQSTVLGWIVEREKDYKRSEKTFSKIKFDGRTLEIEGEVDQKKLVVEEIDEFEDVMNPPPPHTTDTILSEATKIFRMKATEVMDILQDLFEKGFITYHRTDSTRISQHGQGVAKRIFERMGLDVFKPRSWEGGEEGAHEAIRPTKPVSPEEIEEMIEEGVIKDISRRHLGVYSLIFRRFLASQAKEVHVKKQKVKLKMGKVEIEDEVVSEILESGWNLISPIPTFRYEKKSYEIENVETHKKHTIPLFTQATIIEEMRKRKIGRPSTYARTVEILFRRGYVREDKYGRIWPTVLGKMVYQFLKENFTEFVTDETTRKLEEIMDRVESGEEDYQGVLKKLREDFEKIRGEKV
jgi:reverse gyrase